jgi:hypothetical protein
VLQEVVPDIAKTAPQLETNCESSGGSGKETKRDV